jgi:hypothetical protein
VFLIHFGCDPNWLLTLDMLAFSSLSETAMRLDAQKQVDVAYQNRLVAHDDGKGFSKYLKDLQKRTTSGPGGASPDGDDLVSDLTQLGAIR